MLNLGITGGVATTATTAATPSASSPGRMLDDMRTVMAQAEKYSATGSPSGAAAILDTGTEVIAFGQRAIEGLDRQIGQRQQKVDAMRASGASPEALREDTEQIGLMTKLRDMIADHVERIREILMEAGRGGEADEISPRQARADANRRSTEDALAALRQQVGFTVAPQAADVAAAYRSA